MAERVHGGLDARELERHGIDASAVLDLSVNVNPRGPHPAVVDAVVRAAADALADYPDRQATRARRTLAGALDCEPERIALGHGSVELLWSLIAGLRGAGGPLLIVGPTFGEPEAAARAHGVACARVELDARDAFAPDPTRVAAAIAEHAPCAVYLCQPNNPTGRAFGSSQLQALIDAHPRALFLLDQAFLSLSSEHAQLALRLDRKPNVVLIRSLTKDHALAGLRAGYALAAPEWIARIEAQRPPWTVSSLAQAAVIAAAQHPEHVREARECLLDARQQLSAALGAAGFEALPSDTHFLLIKTHDADALRERLLVRHRVLVRSCRSFGLPHHLRIAAGDTAARARLLAALAEEAP
ncbi:MAG TPA: histidinol-phosphate transaminase [Polyangiales bacterium]|nr:histidinol-phosphate transaminase [Polyangiales bacterium]